MLNISQLCSNLFPSYPCFHTFVSRKQNNKSKSQKLTWGLQMFSIKICSLEKFWIKLNCTVEKELGRCYCTLSFRFIVYFPPLKTSVFFLENETFFGISNEWKFYSNKFNSKFKSKYLSLVLHEYSVFFWKYFSVFINVETFFHSIFNAYNCNTAFLVDIWLERMDTVGF